MMNERKKEVKGNGEKLKYPFEINGYHEKDRFSISFN